MMTPVVYLMDATALLIHVGTAGYEGDNCCRYVRSIRAQFRKAIPKRIKLLIFTNDNASDVTIQSVIN